MKSAFIISSLAAAVAAFPAPQVAQIKEATKCPDLDGAKVLSNNNQPYKLECHKWIDSDSVLRITETELGYKGCLTACDGTIGCGVVQYIATDTAQTKGSCTIFPKNATTTIKEGSSNSWTIAIPIEPKVFGGLALRSASPIHFASVNAAQQQFFLNKNTSTYCPAGISGLDCSKVNSNTTIFTQGVDVTTLSLDVMVPGGQQVYVTKGDSKLGQLAGELKFTQAHSAATSGPALYEGFTISEAGDLQFEKKDWFACPIDKFNSGYGIWSVARVKGSNAGAGCLGFSWRVAELPENVTTAWQYE